MVFELGYETTL